MSRPSIQCCQPPSSGYIQLTGWKVNDSNPVLVYVFHVQGSFQGMALQQANASYPSWQQQLEVPSKSIMQICQSQQQQQQYYARSKTAASQQLTQKQQRMQRSQLLLVFPRFGTVSWVLLLLWICRMRMLLLEQRGGGLSSD